MIVRLAPWVKPSRLMVSPSVTSPFTVSALLSLRSTLAETFSVLESVREAMAPTSALMIGLPAMIAASVAPGVPSGSQLKGSVQ